MKLAVIILLASCNYNNLVTENKQFDPNIIIHLNPHWIAFYQNRIENYSSDKFVFDSTWTVRAWLNGNVLADSEPGFDHNFSPYLIYSKDKSQYLDLDSYQYVFDQDSTGHLILMGTEPDQEVNWVNRKTGEVKRIAFTGPGSTYEDARWINNEEVILFGKANNRVFIEVIILPMKKSILYVYPDSLQRNDNYLQKVRLKGIKFEEL
ncbi:MAG: hypothetical protein KDC09_14715 [Bacteroidales bacterium]|nr:hypothetical protein [Bacteroidales bacterium]